MPGEVTLAEALGQVEGGTVKTRLEGLANIKHIFRSNSKFETLSDKSLHKTFDILFACAISEQSEYVKAKTATTRTAAENRLSTCADALREAVKKTVRRIKLKTVRSVQDHLIETLRLPNGKFCEPIALNYAKSLRELLGYQPHVEHLPKEERERIALFCAECIQTSEPDLEDSDAEAGADVASTFKGLSYRSSRSHFKDSGDSQGGRSLEKQIAEELVACLSLLTAAPNATCGDASKPTLTALIEFLKKTTVTAHHDAFAAINHILSWTRTEDIQLTREATGSIVRLMKFYWTVKSAAALKDEILVTSIYLRPYFLSAMQQNSESTLRAELSGLLDVMKTEYGNRAERDQLHLEDLRLEAGTTSVDGTNRIGTAVFCLRPSGTRPEAASSARVKSRHEATWTTVSTLATLCNVLPVSVRDEASSDDEEDINLPPRKRQRVADEFEDTLISSTSGSTPSRVCALQTIAFLAQQKRFSGKEILKAIDKLSASCGEDNPAVVTWALLGLASLASQFVSTGSSLSNKWLSVWQLATRAMGNALTCRPACHLIRLLLVLRLVPQQNMTELVQSMTKSMDLNGPSALSDAAAHMLTEVTRIAQQSNPTSSSMTAETILSWLFRNFWPSRFQDRAYCSQHSTFRPGDIIELITCCIGQSNHTSTAPWFPIWDSIGHVWLACGEQEDLIRYLLLLPEATSITHEYLSSSKPLSSAPHPRPACEPIVLNHLIGELHRAEESWTQTMQERSLGISLDMFTFLCSALCVSNCVAFCCSFRDSRRQTQLQKQIHEFFKTLEDFLSRSNCEQNKVDSMLATFSCACTGLLTPVHQRQRSECEKQLCYFVNRGLESRRQPRELDEPEDDGDEMDIDGAYDSQDSRRRNQSVSTPELKNDYAATCSIMSLRSSMALYAAVISAQNDQDTPMASAESASSSIMDYILSLSEASILSSRWVITRLSEVEVDLTTDDCYRFLEHCTDTILAAYPYERSEVATSVILDIMSSLVSAWTVSENSDLVGLGVDMYGWYTNTALTGGVLSPNVQKRLASLLLQLCHADPDYGRDESVPSVRTSLFKLVQLGNVTVQFHLANRISTIFSLFVLSNHSAMFDDLQESLPADKIWVEGMAMRLLFFAKLAAAWHSLLRQCVYYIFETAGEVKASSRHAGRSILELAKSLNFENPQKIFHLFAPQLLHTWLENHTVTSLPFSIFQYESLDALIAHNRSEMVAQLLIQGNDEGMQTVANVSKSTTKELVLASFAKCLAYCLNWDIAHPPQTKGETTEARLRKLVGGKDDFNSLAVGQFAATMGQIYLSLHQEDVYDAWLDKRPNYSAAAKALAEMKACSHSDRLLPANQQPSFKSRYLCDAIERLCRRTSHDPIKPWGPSSFSLAARMLVDSIDDALGPLHTCLVIRKLRLLISMAGEIPVNGFPLEMLVHTLRPFLSDSQCADDAMGVLQYLFHHGQRHLKLDLPFLFGTVSLMSLQMRKHSGSRQESTTQESQHRNTVQKMQKLHSWLVNFLNQCLPSDGSLLSTEYDNWAKALAQINLPGNARKGTAESSLLLLLLEQDGTDSALLRLSDREEALVLLSENFQPPLSADDDCLERDEDCARLVQKLWNAMQIPSLKETFIVWVAGAIGRAYASTGVRPVSAENTSRDESKIGSQIHGDVEKSQAAISQKLSNLLFSRRRSEASVADFTLRSIVHSFSEAEEALAFEQMIPSSIVPAIAEGTCGYEPDTALRKSFDHAKALPLQHLLEPSSDSSLEHWAKDLGLVLCQNASNVAILPALKASLRHSASLALELLPYIIHILLVKEFETDATLRTELSATVAKHLADGTDALRPKQRFFLNLLLYLRKQSIPGENTHADRLRWLDVDWIEASKAADRCNMPTTALLLAESASQPVHGSRRPSRTSLAQVSANQIPQELLLSIFKSIDEPDSFYGVEQPATLDSVLDRLDYEADGYRSLMFRSAQTDTAISQSHRLVQVETGGMINSLSMLNLDSLTFALLSAGLGTSDTTDNFLNSARRLQQWDVAAPDTTSGIASNSFTAYRELSRATDRIAVRNRLRSIVIAHAEPMTASTRVSRPSHEWLNVLSSLVEADEVVNVISQDELRSKWEQMQVRQKWTKLARFEDFCTIISSRHTLFSVIAQNKSLSTALGIGAKYCRQIEAESLLSISRFARDHDQLQEALTASNKLGDLIRQCQTSGLKADAAAKMETASVLWKSGEATASVKMLRDTLDGPDLESQDISVGRSGLLAQVAHQLAEARLEKPDEILSKYLKPAINHLKGRNEGEEAGKVFHEFASFCDKQLQNPSNIEDFNRITKLRQRKLEEVEELEKLGKGSRRSQVEKDTNSREMTKAKRWFEIDDADYRRLKGNRDTFVEQSLQNYLLALHASDDHDISILRFFTLWLENSDVPKANSVVNKYLDDVPSWKFVVLMNQLMSRLEQEGSAFQNSLKTLLYRLCAEHPHHSLYHLYATTRPPSSRDPGAQSRYEVAMTLRRQLQSDPKAGSLLQSMFKANGLYNMLAKTSTKDMRATKLPVKDLPDAHQVARTVPNLKVPPVTISVPLSRDSDYSNVPVVVRFSSSMGIMSGNSHPKKLTAYASNGQQYSQLFKSGEDDLRQDAIMEQVFEEVSKMLQHHKTTRQRHLHVRTYKVIPLSARSGIIEFVPNSTSFSDFLVSAHERYHPQDYKNNTARSKIAAAQQHSTETRIKEFRKVCEHMQPVLRHFFFERFKDPDEWFEKRTAYTRTTATVSILGHVLGLGDRHCQNIMLDEKTGEVVHIDLGIAFEAGRVLPVPELVPFRLSRDVIDGMGITKTEGVFRRCCEFTMDALREDKDSIMTLLNVLRYDPLYTWSVSPLRAKRMQEDMGRNAGDAEAPEGSSKKKEQEAGEADRALSVVEKKLSQTLSTAAMVNELIQQATDERNLATLFNGWSAYF